MDQNPPLSDLFLRALSCVLVTDITLGIVELEVEGATAVPRERPWMPSWLSK